MVLEKHPCVWESSTRQRHKLNSGAIARKIQSFQWGLQSMDSLSQLSWIKVKGARLCTPNQPINGFKLRAILGEGIIFESSEASLPGIWRNTCVGPEEKTEQWTEIFTIATLWVTLIHLFQILNILPTWEQLLQNSNFSPLPEKFIITRLVEGTIASSTVGQGTTVDIISLLYHHCRFISLKRVVYLGN